MNLLRLAAHLLAAYLLVLPLDVSAQTIPGGGGSGGGVVQVNTTGCITGGPIISGGTGTLAATYPINAQTGTTYTVVAGDGCKLVTFSNAASIAVTLPQTTTAGFGAGFSFDAQTTGAGTVTITPTVSTINGAATLTIGQNQGCTIVSDGTNYQVSACTAAGGAGCQTSGCTFTGAVITAAGANNLPALGVGATTVGLFSGGTNILGFSSAGTTAGAITAAQTWVFGATTASKPVNNGATTPVAEVLNNSSGSANALAILGYRAAATSPATLFTGFSRTSTLGNQTVVQNADQLFRQRMEGSDGTNFQDAAELRLTVDGTPAAGKVPGKIALLTAPAATGTLTETAFFDSSQHVSLGNSGAVPTIGVNACGATTQGTVTAGSNDQSGKVTVGTVTVTACAISFASTWNTAPRACLLTPANSTAAAANTVQAYVSAIGTTSFTITGLTLDSAAFYYFCM